MRREILQLGAVATVVLLLGGGAAAATGTLPLHSVGFNNLKPNLQRLVTMAQRRAKMPAGVHGERGEAGPVGPQGQPGKSAPELPGQAESSETPSEVAVSTVTATSAILETTMGPVDGDGILYQFQLARSPDELRSEVSCPENSVPEVQCLGALASSGEEGFIRQPGDLPTESLLPEDGQRRHVAGRDSWTSEGPAPR